MFVIYMNIIVALIFLALTNSFGAKSAIRFSFNAKVGIFIFAINYFTITTVYFLNTFPRISQRIFLVVLALIMIAYSAYKLKSLSSKASR
jgi:hypothetical protein